jgi:hypothetical protein
MARALKRRDFCSTPIHAVPASGNAHPGFALHVDRPGWLLTIDHSASAQNSPRNHQNSYGHMLRDYEVAMHLPAIVVNHAHRDATAIVGAASSPSPDCLAR